MIPFGQFRRPVSLSPPVVQATANYGSSSASTTHAVNLPTGIAAGQLLLVFFTVGGNDIVTTPSGWTLLGNPSGGATGTQRKLSVFYKTASGGEGSTVNITIDTSQAASAQAYRISGWTSAPQMASATGLSNTPNSPSLSPSWGTANIVWITAMAGRAGAVTNSPSGYSSAGSILGGSNRVTGSAHKTANAASDDPGAFTMNASDEWTASTIGIR